jgi:hypothetical protein
VQLLKQQSSLVVQTAPTGPHEGPPAWHTPFWHTLPAQQSVSYVHVLTPAARHPEAHENPVALRLSGRQEWPQHSSAKLQAAPSALQPPPKFGQQRETPVPVSWQFGLPPEQQF